MLTEPTVYVPLKICDPTFPTLEDVSIISPSDWYRQRRVDSGIQLIPLAMSDHISYHGITIFSQLPAGLKGA